MIAAVYARKSTDQNVADEGKHESTGVREISRTAGRERVPGKPRFPPVPPPKRAYMY